MAYDILAMHLEFKPFKQQFHLLNKIMYKISDFEKSNHFSVGISKVDRSYPVILDNCHTAHTGFLPQKFTSYVA